MPHDETVFAETAAVAGGFSVLLGGLLPWTVSGQGLYASSFYPDGLEITLRVAEVFLGALLLAAARGRVPVGSLVLGIFAFLIALPGPFLEVCMGFFSCDVRPFIGWYLTMIGGVLSAVGGFASVWAVVASLRTERARIL